jgi:hypothetical protein
MPVSDRRDHHGSHQGLLWKPVGPLPTGRPPDAIVVPTRRRPAYLAAVAALARHLDCTLVTLHSGGLTTAAQAARRLPADVNLVAIDIPQAGLRLPHWETSRLLTRTVFTRRTDLSAKRNLALMLSRMLGWSRILFLDDDITGLDPDDIRAASSLLDTHNAVGLHIDGFPDHSVVCHAYRLAGGSQQSFVGGGALAVEAERCNSFFPDIYNDDWFFMLDPKGGLQPVALAGQVRQERFDPFDAARAQAEELGDVLAEGTYWLLDQGQPMSGADERHWADFLVKRRQFIRRVLEMVTTSDLHDGERNRRTAALRGSLARLAQITPELCESYLLAWAADQDRWQRHVSHLPAGLTLHQAVSLLSWPEAPALTWHGSLAGDRC